MILSAMGSACRLLLQRGSCGHNRHGPESCLARRQQAAAACCSPRSEPLKDPTSRATRDVYQAGQVTQAPLSIWQVTLMLPSPCPAPRDMAWHLSPPC